MGSQIIMARVSLRKLTAEVGSPKTHVIKGVGTRELDFSFVDFIAILWFPTWAQVVPTADVVGTVIRCGSCRHVVAV